MAKKILKRNKLRLFLTMLQKTNQRSLNLFFFWIIGEVKTAEWDILSIYFYFYNFAGLKGLTRSGSKLSLTGTKNSLLNKYLTA